ncbi:hypothetical protein BpHYR1_027399 [Brachionus plicatilis]|uniref:CCHC-type domain-containing protein n=1 Tax=Brachionus plicatilis TaxID=10195 RepID=A0A3M7P107_BRAPC|nr:hypothetical protein BpHYR1_027399 [Brachionus plicatilis]
MKEQELEILKYKTKLIQLHQQLEDEKTKNNELTKNLVDLKESLSKHEKTFDKCTYFFQVSSLGENKVRNENLVESTTLTELINLKLDGSGCDEFLIRFQNLCDMLSRTHESDEVRLLIRAVPKRIGEELMLRIIERLDKALNVVRKDGNRPQYYQKTDTGLKKKTNGKRDDIVCYKCNKRVHVKKDCKSKYKDKGHKGNYKKINVENAISASESSADEDQCNMAAEGKFLTSRGLIDGKPMKIAFDCGATVSII